MKQLSGIDASFLNMETSTQFGHVNSLSILDPSTDGAATSTPTFKRTVEERLHLLEIYRRKLVDRARSDSTTRTGSTTPTSTSSTTSASWPSRRLATTASSPSRWRGWPPARSTAPARCGSGT